MRAGHGVAFKEKYEDAWRLLRLLPEEPPLQPAAAGFISVDRDLLDSLTSKAGLELGGLGQALGTINVEDIAYVAYAEDDLRLPESVDREFVEEFRGSGCICGPIHLSRLLAELLPQHIRR